MFIWLYVFNSNQLILRGTNVFKEEIGLSTLELGYIGLAFSITYGLGKTLLGYFVDGRNTKRIIISLFILSAGGLIWDFFKLLWFSNGIINCTFVGLNGVFQSVGGPASYSTISKI